MGRVQVTTFRWNVVRDDESVAAMIAFCHDGPGRARVGSVDVDEDEPEGLDGF